MNMPHVLPLYASLSKTISTLYCTTMQLRMIDIYIRSILLIKVSWSNRGAVRFVILWTLEVISLLVITQAEVWHFHTPKITTNSTDFEIYCWDKRRNSVPSNIEEVHHFHNAAWCINLRRVCCKIILHMWHNINIDGDLLTERGNRRGSGQGCFHQDKQ